MRPQRFSPLDGLRGVAALAVAVYHFQQRIPFLDAQLPRAVSLALQHGNLGVQVFFVLSGFAVARSLSGAAMSARTFGRFLLRRTLRLDPPYVFTVLLVCALALWSPARWPVRPSFALVGAHVLYLQGLLGMPHLQGVFWTLCIEFQLYATFGLLYAFAQRAGLTAGDEHGFGAALSLSAVVTAASTWSTPGASRTLVPFWSLFVLGVLVERADRLPAARRWLQALFVALLVPTLRWPQLEAAAGLATCALLYAAARAPALAAALSTRPLLALGRGSYSFYLIHALAAGVVFDALAPRSALGDAGRVASAFGASGLAAWALHRVIELPAQRWSRRVGAPRGLLS